MDQARPVADGNSIETSKTQRAQLDINAFDAASEESDSLRPECSATGAGSSGPTAEHFTTNNSSSQSTFGVVGNTGSKLVPSDSLGFSNISLIINPGPQGLENGLERSTDKFTLGSISDTAGFDSSAHQGKLRQFVTDKKTAGSGEFYHILSNTDSKEEDAEAKDIECSGKSDAIQDVNSTDLPSLPTSATSAVTSSLTTLNLNLDLPPASQRISNGFGVRMVSTASSQTLIYRSIPARPLSYTLTDVLDSTRPGGSKHRSKTAPVSTNAPEDYAQRFKSRPTTRPKVIEFDGTSVSSKSHRTVVSTGFPTARARIYIGHPKTKTPTETNGETQASTSRAGSKLQLQPLSNPPQQVFSSGRSSTGHVPSTSRTQRSEKPPRTAGSSNQSVSQHQRSLTKSAASSTPGYATKSTTSSTKATENLKETSQSIDFSTSIPADLPTDDEFDHIHNPDILLTSSADCDDISTLPRPKKVLPKRELPWVFRYKVKRGMNTLSRIMASKPPQGLMQSNHAFS